MGEVSVIRTSAQSTPVEEEGLIAEAVGGPEPSPKPEPLPKEPKSAPEFKSPEELTARVDEEEQRILAEAQELGIDEYLLTLSRARTRALDLSSGEKRAQEFMSEEDLARELPKSVRGVLPYHASLYGMTAEEWRNRADAAGFPVDYAEEAIGRRGVTHHQFKDELTSKGASFERGRSLPLALMEPEKRRVIIRGRLLSDAAAPPTKSITLDSVLPTSGEVVVSGKQAGFYGSGDGLIARDLKDDVLQRGESGYKLATILANQILEDEDVREHVNVWGNQEQGWDRYIDFRTNRILKQSRMEGLTGDQYEAVERKARLRAGQEIALLKTVGAWPAPVFVPYEISPDGQVSIPKASDMSLGQALLPNVEVVGMKSDRSGNLQVVARQTGPMQYAFDMADLLQSATVGAIERKEGESYSDAVVRGIANRRNAFEYALESEFAKDHPILAGLGGFAAAVAFPDAFVGFGAAKLGGKVAAPIKYGAAARKLTPDLKTVAEGRAAAAAHLKKAVEYAQQGDDISAAKEIEGAKTQSRQVTDAEVRIKDQFDAQMKILDRHDARVAERLSQVNSNIGLKDSAPLRANLPGSTLANAHIQAHPSYRQSVLSAREGSRLRPQTRRDELYDLFSPEDATNRRGIIDRLWQARFDINTDNWQPYAVEEIWRDSQIQKPLLDIPEQQNADLLAALRDRLPDMLNLDKATFERQLASIVKDTVDSDFRSKVLSSVAPRLWKTVEDSTTAWKHGDRKKRALKALDDAVLAVGTNNEARAVAAAIQYKEVLGRVFRKGEDLIPKLMEDAYAVTDLSERAIRFADQLSTNLKLDDKVAQRVARILDGRASVWASKTGRQASAWWDTRVGQVEAVRAGKPYLFKTPKQPRSDGALSLNKQYSDEGKPERIVWSGYNSQGLPVFSVERGGKIDTSVLPTKDVDDIRDFIARRYRPQPAVAPPPIPTSPSRFPPPRGVARPRETPAPAPAPAPVPSPTQVPEEAVAEIDFRYSPELPEVPAPPIGDVAMPWVPRDSAKTEALDAAIRSFVKPELSGRLPALSKAAPDTASASLEVVQEGRVTDLIDWLIDNTTSEVNRVILNRIRPYIDDDAILVLRDHWPAKAEQLRGAGIDHGAEIERLSRRTPSLSPGVVTTPMTPIGELAAPKVLEIMGRGYSVTGLDESIVIHELLHVATVQKLGTLFAQAKGVARTFDAPSTLAAAKTIEDFEELRGKVYRSLRSRRGRATTDAEKRKYDYFLRHAAPRTSSDARGAEGIELTADWRRSFMEFITYGFTDPEFQSILKNIRVDRKNAWTQFVETVAKLFNVPRTRKMEDGLTRLIGLTDKVLETPAVRSPGFQEGPPTPISISRMASDASAAGADADDVEKARRLYEERGVESPYFKQWFGDSKIVDAEGKPLVVYHGTAADFDAFDTKGAAWQALGSHFGSSAQANKVFETNYDAVFGRPAPVKGRSLVPVYLSLTNPIRLEDAGGSWVGPDVLLQLKQKGITPDWYEGPERSVRWIVSPEQAKMEGYALRKAQNTPGSDEMSRRAFQNIMSEGRVEFIQRTIQEAGHDGVVYRNAFEGGGDSYIAFEPEQIKSVFNRGTFDSSPNISRMAADPSVPPTPTPQGLRALTEFTEDGIAIIRVFENASGAKDPAVIIREVGKILRRDLDPSDFQSIVDYIKSQKPSVFRGLRGVANRFTGVSDEAAQQAEEAFADVFEAYVRFGVSPSPSLTPPLEELKQSLLRVYSRMPTNQLPEEVSGTLDQMLATDLKFDRPFLTTVLEHLKKEILGVGRQTRETQVFKALADEATRLGMDVDVEDLVKQFDENGELVFDKPFMKEYHPDLFTLRADGKYVLTNNKIGELSKLIEQEVAAVAGRQTPKAGLRAALDGIQETSTTEALRQITHGPGWGRMLRRGAAAVMFGGDAYFDIRHMPPVMRLNIMASVRPIQESIGAAVRLGLEADVERVGKFLGGEALNYREGRSVVASGQDYFGSASMIVNRMVNRLDPEDQLLLKTAAELSQKAGRTKTRWSELLNKLSETDRDKINELVNQFLDETAQSEYLNAIARAANLVGDQHSPVDRVRLLEQMLYYAGVVSRDGQKVSGSPVDISVKFMREVEARYNKGVALHIGAVVAGHGAAERTRQILSGLGVIVDEETAEGFRRWINGLSLKEEDALAADKYLKFKDVAERMGLDVTLYEDFLSEGYYIPQAVRERIGASLARANIPPPKKGRSIILSADDELTGFASLAYTYMKTRMTRGAFMIRQRYFLMNTMDHFGQLAMTLGLMPAVMSTVRVLAQDLFILPTVARSLYFAQKAGVAPDEAAEIVRRGLQRGGDKAAQAVGRLFNASKYRIDLNDIMDGKDTWIRVGNKLVNPKEVRRIAVEEGIFSSFDTRALERNVRRETAKNMRDAVDANTSLKRKVANVFDDVLKMTQDTAEAWSERERLGAMVTMMEMGFDTRAAARVTIDALYDYAGSMSQLDRKWLINMILPFWAFQKNANRHVFDMMFSSWGAYRMGVLRRSQEYGADLISYLAYDGFVDPYGVDVENLPPEVAQQYWWLRKVVEIGYGSLETIPDDERQFLEGVFGPLDQLDPASKEFLEGGYGGVNNVPTEVRKAMHMLFLNRSTVVEDGKVYELNYILREAKKQLNLGTSPWTVQRPDKAGLPSLMRHRSVIFIPERRTEEVVKWWELAGQENPDFPVMMLMIPDSTINAGVGHLTSSLALMVLGPAFVAEQGLELAGIKDPLSAEFVGKPQFKNLVTQLFPYERAPLLAPLAEGFLGVDTGAPRSKIHPKIRKTVEVVQGVLPIHQDIAETIPEFFGVEVPRWAAVADPYAEQFYEQQGYSEEEVKRLTAVRPERYYLPPGVWTLIFENAPGLGEFNRMLFDLDAAPLEMKGTIRSKIAFWARNVLGAQTGEFRPSRTAQFEDVPIPR